MPQSEELREKAKEILHKATANDISLVWVLGEIHGSKIYRDWGFASFRDWYKSEGTGSPSLSHAYALARIGKTFLSQREEIDAGIREGKHTIRGLMDLVSEYDQGENFETVVGKLANPEPEETDPFKRKNPFLGDPERPREVRLHVKQGDTNVVVGGLIWYCIYNKLRSFSDAFQAWGIEEWTGFQTAKDSKFFQENFKIFEKYAPIISAGQFFCASCNNVPLEPTLHHILPVSVGRGYGPQALLCWPCHEQIVQPKWRQWLTRWGKKHDFTYQSLKNEAEAQLAQGEVDQSPTLIVVGVPQMIGK